VGAKYIRGLFNSFLIKKKMARVKKVLNFLKYICRIN